MESRLMDGWAALTLGALAGGALTAWVTPAARSSPLAGALAGRLPGVGGEVHSLDLSGPAPDPAAGREGAAIWLCMGEELAGMLDALNPGRPEGARAGAGAGAPAGGPAVLVISLPPSPGLAAVLRHPGPRCIWSPGSSRMAYRLAAAGCRAVRRGEGPALLLLDGELPPETVAVPAAQVPGQAAPTVRTGPRDVTDPAPPPLGADAGLAAARRAAGRGAEIPPAASEPVTKGGVGETPATVAGEPERAFDAGTEGGMTPVPGPGELLAAWAQATAPEDLLPFHHAGPDDPEILLVGTGTAFGELARARTELQGVGRLAAHLHLRQLRPVPWELVQPVWSSAGQVLVAEPPGGGLAMLLETALAREQGFTVVENLDQLAATLQSMATGLPGRVPPGPAGLTEAAERPHAP